MKTLIFCAGAPNPNLNTLNQQHDLLVGVDAGAQTLWQHGHLPDWAIGDFDSAPPPPCRHIVRLQPEKNDTDLEYALQHILANYAAEKIEKIIILGALGGGRLDHLLANVYLAHQPRFADFVAKFHFVEQDNSLRFYRSGSHTIQREGDKKYLSFIGLTPLRQLSLHNVRYPLQQADFDAPIALISNEFLLNSMTFSLQNGTLAVIQSRDAATSLKATP
ncbi:thiamine diphosphokinase [Alysiella filiformis DSM 16848]|uniref:Thiamine diphosphokinase n=2 Tax=Alysiella TaxID=194195 RepID=A0A286EGS6_9NEIS|nr:thiamine diphosphokinase [Alysiella filiformis]SOD70122.1 thiamine diphosphokinase [Alysiella filiformis DSM 16848]